MTSQLKRLLWKASTLAVVANVAFLFAQYQEHGRLVAHDYGIAAASLFCSILLLLLMGALLSRYVSRAPKK